MAKIRINPVKFAKELAALRTASNVSQETIAYRGDISLKRLKKIEAGKAKRIKKKDCKRIGKALKLPLPVVEFLGIDPKPMQKVLADVVVATQEAIRMLVSEDKKKKSK